MGIVIRPSGCDCQDPILLGISQQIYTGSCGFGSIKPQGAGSEKTALNKFLCQINEPGYAALDGGNIQRTRGDQEGVGLMG